MTEDRNKDALKAYLDQYYRAKRRLDALRWRLIDARDALSRPAIQSGLSSVSHVKGAVSAGAASPVLKEDSLSERFERERTQCASIMREVLDTLSLLAWSKEREILEYRHIDGLRWKEISGKLDLSRATCRRHYERGLERLLSFDSVQARLADFALRRDRAET